MSVSTNIDPACYVPDTKTQKHTIKVTKKTKPQPKPKLENQAKFTPPIKSTPDSHIKSETCTKSEPKLETQSKLETYNKTQANCSTSINSNPDKNPVSWDDLFDQINDTTEITTEELVGAAIYSISAVEALEQMQAHQDNLDPVIKKLEKDCYKCGGLLRTKHNVMICQKCGLEIQGVIVSTQEDESTTICQDANVNDKGFISMKIVGKGSYGFNRNLLKNCADYTRYRKMTTLKEMNNWNSQSLDNQLPKNVIEDANDMFATIRDHGYVYRKDVKKGMQGSCLYYMCHINGISRTPAEIAKIAGTAEKFLSAGDRQLRDLNERGIITLPAKIDATSSYVNRYFELLQIDEKYKPFVLDMIAQADEDRLHVLHDSKSNTKCIGTIYMLIDRVPDLRKTIDKEKIEKECDISKTTFVKYYTMLCHYYRRFAHIFIEHRIPLKSEWREDINEVDTRKKSKVIYARRVKQTTPEDDVTKLIHEELGITIPTVKKPMTARKYTRLSH